MPVEDLEGDLATERGLREAIARSNFGCFLGCGHGSEVCFTGQFVGGGYEVMLVTPGKCGVTRYESNRDNTELMRGRIVYLLSCLAGKRLGPALIAAGARAFIGYKDIFVFVVRSHPECRPWPPAMDPYATPFARVTLPIVLSLIRGRTVGEAYEASMNAYEREIERWVKSPDPIAREIIKFLIWDRDATVLLGDSEARASEPRSMEVLARVTLLGFLGTVLAGTV